PNNIPVITGCEPGADHNVYFLSTPPCTPVGHCFSGQAWVKIAGLKGVQAAVDLNGQVYVLDSTGAVSIATCAPADDTDSCISGGAKLTPALSPQCIGWLAPTMFDAVTEVGVTPTTTETDTEDFLWGVGCTKDSNGNSNILSWNLNLTDDQFGIHWDQSPWVQRGNGAVQIAMFTYPHNGNAQVPWVISSP